MWPALAYAIPALEKSSEMRAKKGRWPDAMKATVLLFHDVVPTGLDFKAPMRTSTKSIARYLNGILRP